jgi:hypothetical protein
VIEITEFSYAHGYMTQGENSLKRVFEQKQLKYRQLAQGLSKSMAEWVRVMAIIMPSPGYGATQSLKHLHIVLRCNDRQPKELGRRMSETLMRASMEIWK